MPWQKISTLQGFHQRRQSPFNKTLNPPSPQVEHPKWAPKDCRMSVKIWNSGQNCVTHSPARVGRINQSSAPPLTLFLSASHASLIQHSLSKAVKLITTLNPLLRFRKPFQQVCPRIKLFIIPISPQIGNAMQISHSPARVGLIKYTQKLDSLHHSFSLNPQFTNNDKRSSLFNTPKLLFLPDGARKWSAQQMWQSWVG